MTIKDRLMNGITAILILSAFTMCSKKPNAIEKVKTDSTVTTNPTGTTNPTKPTTPATPNLTCTYTIQPSQWMVDGAKIPAGSVLCIPAGNRGALLLQNLKGTADKPIVIINKGGKVIINTTITASYAFKTQNCQFFKVMGNGDASAAYGIEISGGNLGMSMDGLSSDFEINNVEVHNTGFAGIMAKTDPTCDVTTQRGHFTMSNVLLHNNYVHNTGGEGFYIGNSFYAEGVSASCGTVFPHDVVNAKIYDNLTVSTGAEGIQVGSATKGCEIYGNTVKSPGAAPFSIYQNNGIQIGEGTGGKCYNNLIENAPGNGIILLGLGDNLVFNNYILNSGGEGIFADSRYTPGPAFQFINNTIVNTALDGIKLNSETIPMNTVINNVIINPGSGIGINRKSTSVKLTSENNYVNKDVTTCKFVNFNGGDFHLQSTSPLINAGHSVAFYGVTFDFYGKARPAGSAFDIGATEY